MGKSKYNNTYLPTFTREFWSDLSNLPANVRSKADRTISKMLEDPWATELHPEKIQHADTGMHSCRVDRGYRIIWKHVKPNDIIFCLVDNHDNAYRRAGRRQVTLDDGIVKVVDVLQVETTTEKPEFGATDWRRFVKKNPGKLFIPYLDDELLAMGVTQDQLSHLRMLDDLNELDGMDRMFETVVYDRLLAAAMGEYDRPAVPDSEISKSLARNQGGDELYKFVDGEEFERALAGDLEEWMLFLAPFQRKIAKRNYNGPARVKGVAGSGKTVVAIHRTHFMYKIAEKYNQKILFLTYGNRLPSIIQHLIERLEGHPIDENVLECTTLHSWCSQFVKKHDRPMRVDGRRLTAILGDAIQSAKAQHPKMSSLWERPTAFFAEEIQISIKGRLVRSLEAYQKLDRSGRGTPLQSRERLAMWAVYEAYQAGLVDAGLHDWDDFIVRAYEILDAKPHLQGMYRGVVVDEIQDFSEAGMRLIAMLAAEGSNNLFLVGDGLQRIYQGGYSLNQVGIDVVGRSSVLRQNYRNTEQILLAAHTMMAGLQFDDMDDKATLVDEPQYSVRAGKSPLVKQFHSSHDEIVWIGEEIKRLKRKHGYRDGDFALLYRWKSPYKNEIEQVLSPQFQVVELTKSSDTYFGDGLKHTTFHSVKGLEFKVIFLVGVVDGQVPSREGFWQMSDDEQDEYLARERRLLYVAMTRARDLLYLTYSRGVLSGFLQGIEPPILEHE